MSNREIELTDEQALLAQSASDFLAKHGTFEAARRRAATETGYDESLWREMGALGWLGVSLPDAYGGAGMPVGALVALAEPMGRRLFASPWLATTLAGRLLLEAGNERQRQAWLPKLASGAVIGTVALTEPEGSWEVGAPALAARRDGSGYVLDGTKTFVLDAGSAQLILVSASLDGVPAIFAVEAGTLPKGALRREILIDEGRRCHRLDLRALRVPAEACLDGGGAAAALDHVGRVGALLVAAEMTGGTEGAMELTLEYLRTRKQFGHLIGSYQALKHPMVEIMIAQEEARSLVHHAATCFDDEPVIGRVAVHMAKALAGETFTHAADRAIQFHGAIGFTYECHAQLYLRRAQWSEHTFGDAAHHRRRLEPLLLDASSPYGSQRPPTGGLPGS